jgi:hypothetical protein
MRLTKLIALLAAFALAAPASAGYILEIDTDGLDDGVLTFHPNFSFGGNTTSASQSAPAVAVGLTGGDSIFGGNAPSGTTVNDPDTYVYTYSPGLDGDNDNGLIDTGTALNATGDFGSGLPSTVSDTYAIYAAWPLTSNVSNPPTNYVLNDGTSDVFSISIDPNTNDGTWVKLGEVALDAAKNYTLTQTNTPVETIDPFGGDSTFTNGFVSQRAAAVFFDRIPEPTSALLALVGVAGLAFRRR